ncbi:MAG: endonuclease/exonuclease/phosphatase family protein [Syntrophomonas sp.]
MPHLTIATYNIQHGKGMDGKTDLERIAQVLSGIDADIIFLQEIDMLRPQSHMSRQVSRLCSELVMKGIYGPVRTYPLGSYGNAILSRYQISEKCNHILPDPSDQRCCLQAELRIKRDTVQLFTTHLGLRQQVRCQHIKDCILPMVNSCPGPVILGGDFNANPDRPEIGLVLQSLSDTFTANTGPLVNTYPATVPAARIDYIFINELCKVEDYYIVDSTASDHLPVVTEIEI